MSKKIILNSLSGGLVPLVKIVITFVMAPLIVRSLGDYDYGVWEIVFAIVGYMGVLDLGLMPALVRGVSRYHALGDRGELGRIFSTSLAYFVPLGLVLSVGLLGAVYAFPEFFGHKIGSGEQKYFVFFSIIAVQLLFSFIGGVFDGYLEGLQHYILRNGLTIIFSLGGALVLYPLLYSGGGLIALAAVNTIGFTLKCLIYGALLTMPEYGRFRFRFTDVSFATLRELFNFGIRSFVYALSLRVSTLSDSLVIGAILGPIAVTYYALPINLLNHARNLIWSATRNFMPLFSELHALNHEQQSREVLFKSSRVALGIILPLLAGLCLLGPSFIEYWMGPRYSEEGRWVIYIMAGAYLAQWINPFGNRFLTGLGRHGVQARLGIYNSLSNLALSLGLVHLLGKEGVALGTLLPSLLIEPLLLQKTCQLAGTGTMAYVSKVLLPLAIPCGLFCTVLWGGILLWPPTSLTGVLATTAVMVMLYLPVFYSLVLSPHERSIIMGRLRRRALPAI